MNMKLRDCYEHLGGDYKEVLTHLRTETRVEKFLLLFLKDESYTQLIRCLEIGDDAGAFRAVHTLKGICQNLSFTRLFQSSSALTEALRNGRTGDVSGLVREVEEDYERTIGAIRIFEAEMGGQSS